MKVLILGLNFAPELTGTGRCTADFAAWLSGRGHEVRVITAPPYYPEWSIAAGYAAWKWRREMAGPVQVLRCPIWLSRTRGVGVIEPDVAISYSLTGACLRGSGINYDIRKATPYLYYDRLEFDVPLGTHGDVYDRYLVRMEEMRQSIRIVEQCMEQMPTDGPLSLTQSPYVIPPHDTVLTTAEDMQRHFIWVIKGFSPPKGEVYQAIEHSKGELGYYIVSDGTPIPYRMRLRTPDFVNMQALPYMAEGASLADVVALIGTIDIVLGSVDR
jgi:NADH-quinone oxidoreductase subunit D